LTICPCDARSFAIIVLSIAFYSADRFDLQDYSETKSAACAALLTGLVWNGCLYSKKSRCRKRGMGLAFTLLFNALRKIHSIGMVPSLVLL
jgi:hypothetical protein